MILKIDGTASISINTYKAGCEHKWDGLRDLEKVLADMVKIAEGGVSVSAQFNGTPALALPGENLRIVYTRYLRDRLAWQEAHSI